MSKQWNWIRLAKKIAVNSVASAARRARCHYVNKKWLGANSPSRKRWILGAVRFDPCSAVANTLSIPPGEYVRKNRPSTKMGWNAWMPNLCRVGALFSNRSRSPSSNATPSSNSNSDSSFS